MPPPGVSVVIVNWNTRDMVLRLLASLSAPHAGSAHELELIVVDNDSSDESAEAVRRQFPAVKLVAQAENRGFAGGVNPGIRAAEELLGSFGLSWVVGLGLLFSLGKLTQLLTAQVLS